MCEECGQYFCPSACPSFSGFVVGRGKPRCFCSFCEEGIYQGDSYYQHRGIIACKDCAEALLPSELLDFLGALSREEIFEMLCIEGCEA